MATPGPLNQAETRHMPRVVDVGPIPEDPGANYSYALTRGGPSSKVDTITATLEGVSWLCTLTYTGDDLTAISAWVRL